MRKGPESSVSCPSGALICLYSCTGNDRRDATGSYQWHFDGCIYCFERINRNYLTCNMTGAQRDAMQQSNGVGRGGEEGGGHRPVGVVALSTWPACHKPERVHQPAKVGSPGER